MVSRRIPVVDIRMKRISTWLHTVAISILIAVSIPIAVRVAFGGYVRFQKHTMPLLFGLLSCACGLIAESRRLDGLKHRLVSLVAVIFLTVSLTYVTFNRHEEYVVTKGTTTYIAEVAFSFNDNDDTIKLFRPVWMLFQEKDPVASVKAISLPNRASIHTEDRHEVVRSIEENTERFNWCGG